MSFNRVDSDPPDFINPEGVKWWHMGVSVAPGDIWATELPSGEQEYVGIIDGHIVAASSQMEAVALKLEMSEYAKRWSS